MPTYNERRTLPALVREILSHLAIDVLVVDDDSPDGTGRWAEHAAQAHPRVHVLHREGKQGLGSAYKAGFAWGLQRGFDPLFEMDADGSHHPAYLPDMLALVEGGADLVIGSRFVQGGGIEDWPRSRRLLSWGSNVLTRLLLGIKVRDATAGFRAYRAQVLQAIDLSSVQAEGYSFQEEMLFRVLQADFKVLETPIVFTDRMGGHTKISRWELLAAVGTLGRLWWATHRGEWKTHPVPRHLPMPSRLMPVGGPRR